MMMNSEKQQYRSRLSWKDVIQLLTRSKRRLRLRIVDTVFLEAASQDEGLGSSCQVIAWYITSKKGDVIKRKSTTNLSLQHVFDRFCRLSLTGPNATGLRIVAVGHIDDGKRRTVNFTVDQMEREVKNPKGALLRKCASIHNYLLPCEGNGNSFRGVYKSQVVPGDLEDAREKKRDIMVYLFEDPMMASEDGHRLSHINFSMRRLGGDSSALLKWIQQEIDVSVSKIVKQLESAISISLQEKGAGASSENVVSRLSADFILDADKQLWLVHVDNVVIGGDGMDLYDLEFNKTLESPNESCSLPMDLSGTPKLRKNKKAPTIEDSNSINQESCEKIVDIQLEKSSTSISEADHCKDMEDKISVLKKQLVSKTQAKDEQLSKINNLRTEVEGLLECEDSPTNQPDTQLHPKKKTLPASVNPIGTKQRERLCTISNDDDIIRSRKELKAARDENCQLHETIANRGRYDDIIVRLQNERNQIAEQLKEEQFKHNENRRDIEIKTKEARDIETRSREEAEFFKLELESERDRHEKSLSQLKSANKVLQAEIKAQRDYVEDLRVSSWTDLAEKVKASIHAVTSQELAKSSLGVAQAVTSCEERWKKRVEEITNEHNNDIYALNSDHQNELRYKTSQFRIEIEQSRAEVEERLQQKHAESLKAALSHKELQRQTDVKNEIKRWEQIMSEIKARLHSEYQKKNQKNLAERDIYWKSKLKQQIREADAELEREKDHQREDLRAIHVQHDANLTSAINDINEKNKDAIRTALGEAEEKSAKVLQQKEIEIETTRQNERKILMEQMDEEVQRRVAIALRTEHAKAEEAKTNIASMTERHEEEVRKLHEATQNLKKDLEVQQKNMIEQIELSLSERNKEEIEMTRLQFESKLEQMNKANETRIQEIRSEANCSIATHVKATKEEADRVLEDALNVLSLEHDERIESLEYDLGWIRNQKETAERSVKKLENTISEKEEKIEELRDEVGIQQTHKSFDRFFLVAKVISLQSTVKAKDDEKRAMARNLQQKHSETEKSLRIKIEGLERRSSKFEGRMKMISSTLLNHKRDALLGHKMRSREVAAKLQQANEKMEVVETKRKKVHSFLDNLEHAIHDVEKKLQDHSQTSALQGGKINISHARKKRRLDEEYEQFLSKIELKRDEFLTIDEEAKRLQAQKNAINDEMRQLERSLVELLVEQQKRLLSIASRGEGSDTKY